MDCWNVNQCHNRGLECESSHDWGIAWTDTIDTRLGYDEGLMPNPSTFLVHVDGHIC